MQTQALNTLEKTIEGFLAICKRLINGQPPSPSLYPPDTELIQRLQEKFRQQKITLLLSASGEGKSILAKQALEDMVVIESNYMPYRSHKSEIAWLLARLHAARGIPTLRNPGKADVENYFQTHQSYYLFDSLEAVEEMYLRDLLQNHFEWLDSLGADFHILFVARPTFFEDEAVIEVTREYIRWQNVHIEGLFNGAMRDLNLPISSLNNILEPLYDLGLLDKVYNQKEAIALIDDFCGHSRTGGGPLTYSLQTVAQGFHDCFNPALHRLSQITNPGGQ